MRVAWAVEVQDAWAAEERAVWAVVEAGIRSGCSEVSAEGRGFSAAGAGALVAVAVSSAVEAVA